MSESPPGGCCTRLPPVTSKMSDKLPAGDCSTRLRSTVYEPTSERREARPSRLVRVTEVGSQDLRADPNHDWFGSNHCNYNPSLGGRWCTRPWCSRHGQFQRVRVARNIEGAARGWGRYYGVTLRFDALLDWEPVAVARRRFCRRIRDRFPGADVLTVLHFKHLEAHLHATLWMNPTILGSWASDRQIRCIAKNEWSGCLGRVGITDGASRRVYCEPVDDFAKWIAYTLRTGQVLPPEECPPRDSRWRMYPSVSNFFSPKNSVGTLDTPDGVVGA